VSGLALYTIVHLVGIIFLVALLTAYVAKNRRGLAGAWRPIFVATAIASLYFNVFVLVVQLFRRVPALAALAPTQTETPFQLTQLAVLVAFVTIGIVASTRFRPGSASAERRTPLWV
jgi:hypothetical protein